MHNRFKLKQALLALAVVLVPILIYGQTQSGALDPSFGSGGKAINDFGGRIALLPDGKMVAAGGASAADGFDFALSRFNANGTVDTTFGSGGRVTTDLGGRFEGASSIAVQPDGKIVTGGYAVVPINQFANFALVRYNSDGSLDLSFGTGGKVLTNFGNISAQAYSMALQPDGKIVLAGYVNFNGSESFALARYNTDGTLDAGFGTGGKVHTEFG
ncbi:MAG TPA: delta-60 repeat domain-containing protein, partial [Pyrinomonadaceae bacterium]